MINDSKRKPSQFRRWSNRLVIGLIFGLLFTADALGRNSSEPIMNDLVGGEIWQKCEAYFNQIETLKSKKRNHRIRDLSLAFLRDAKLLRPNTKKEALLFAECVNMANGNATHSFYLIRKEEKDDDEFMNLALNDAINNSNASRHEYISKIEGKYNFELDIETAKADYKNSVQQATRAALQTALQHFQLVQNLVSGMTPNVPIDTYGYNNFGYLGSGGAAVAIGSFFSMTAAIGHLYLNSTLSSSAGPGGRLGGGKPAVASAPPGGYTAAPIGPTTPTPADRAKPDKSPEQQIVVNQNQIENEQLKQARAPLASLSCAVLKFDGDESFLVSVRNICNFPIEWKWCWLKKGKATCVPNATSGIISPGESLQVNGPAEGEFPKANYFVCNMIDNQKFCLN